MSGYYRGCFVSFFSATLSILLELFLFFLLKLYKYYTTLYTACLLKKPESCSVHISETRLNTMTRMFLLLCSEEASQRQKPGNASWTRLTSPMLLKSVRIQKDKNGSSSFQARNGLFRYPSSSNRVCRIIHK